MKNIFLYVILFVSVAACAGNPEKRSSVVMPNSSLPAVVKVLLTEKGIPVVDVDTIVVRDGQRIIWVGPSNMIVSFPKESPFKEGKFKSRSGVVNIVANKKIDWKGDEKYRAYKYDIVVGDIVLDPILIRRRNL